MKITGIYRILNTLDGNCYVGSSRDIIQRWQVHKSPKSTSRLVREAMQRDGIENFKLEILEECAVELLTEREHCWINTLKPQYNIRGYGASINSVSEETKRLISEAQKGRAPWNKGKETSEETKAKLSEKSKAASALRDMSDNGRQRSVKCVETEAVYASIRAASADTGVPYKTIQKILSGATKNSKKLHFIYV